MLQKDVKIENVKMKNKVKNKVELVWLQLSPITKLIMQQSLPIFKYYDLSDTSSLMSCTVTLKNDILDNNSLLLIFTCDIKNQRQKLSIIFSCRS